MATINIRRDVADPFYRYKMERLQSKIEGKGNGIKTVIVNLSSVAQSLARPAAYVIKYFGFELGAQTTTNPADDRWIINGAHEAAKLQDYLDGFISKFVLCKKCKNPETDVMIKDGTITLDCKACGQRSDVDPRLKLSSFILKNEPKKGKKDKGDKKARRAAKGHKDANGDTANGENGSPGSNSDNAEDDDGDMAPEAGSDDEFTRRITAEAEEIKTPEVKDKDVEWTMDTSEAAVKARAQELPDELNTKLTIDEDEDGEGGAGNAYDQLGEWIGEEAKAKSGVDNVDDVDIYVKAMDLGIETKHKTLIVLAQTIFDENIVAQITKRAGMLKKMVTSEKHEKALLGGTERFIGNEHPDLIAQVPKILLAFYQEDILTEETLQTWKKASKKYVDINVSKAVRKAALPFLTWLETAESDNSDGSGSDD